jgi:hypothetical protein
LPLAAAMQLLATVDPSSILRAADEALVIGNSSHW